MTIISDSVINARQFAEYYSGKYFTNCDTFDETKRCLASESIFIGEGVRLTDIFNPKYEGDNAYVVVEFSTEDDYTQHEIRAMRIQKKYLSRFLRNMNSDD